MRTALSVVVVLGLTVFAGAQTSIPDNTMLANQVQLSYGRAWQDSPVTHLSGSVELKLGTIRITADEADVNNATGEVDLRGDVHLSTGTQTSVPEITALANQMQQEAPLTHLRGSVELQQGTIRMTADEADMNSATGKVDLRGNVRLYTR